MSPVATETRVDRYGVLLGLYVADPTIPVQVQRAPDLSGSPDTGNAEIIGVAGAGAHTYMDMAPTGATFHYRARHINEAGETSANWTAWVDGEAARSPDAPQALPPLSLPVVEPKASQTGATGTITLEVTDPMSRVTATAFEPSSGGGAFDLSTDPTGWAVYDTTDPYTLTDDVTLTSKHTSRIAWAVRYTDADGNAQWYRGVETFDLDVIAEVTNITVDFNVDGEAVISATGDEDTSNMYVTVGDGTTPSDPTAGTNNGTISGRNGTVDTGVAITTANEAYVKVVAADSLGVLGPVQSARQARRLGVFHMDTSARSTTSGTETTLETITVRGNTLGADGLIRVQVVVNVGNPNDAAYLRVRYQGTAVVDESFSALGGGIVVITLWISARGSTSSQRIVANTNRPTTPLVVNEFSDFTENTTSDTSLTVTGQADHALTDSVAVVATIGEYMGTP